MVGGEGEHPWAPVWRCQGEHPWVLRVWAWSCQGCGGHPGGGGAPRGQGRTHRHQGVGLSGVQGAPVGAEGAPTLGGTRVWAGGPGGTQQDLGSTHRCTGQAGHRELRGQGREVGLDTSPGHPRWHWVPAVSDLAPGQSGLDDMKLLEQRAEQLAGEAQRDAPRPRDTLLFVRWVLPPRATLALPLRHPSVTPASSSCHPCTSQCHPGVTPMSSPRHPCATLTSPPRHPCATLAPPPRHSGPPQGPCGWVVPPPWGHP